MITTIGELTKNQKFGKILYWSKLISITGSAQVLVQATGLMSGILVIRLLSTQEYALYTLANTMLGTMTILADSGISNGVMAEGGKVWQDKSKLGIVLNTGLLLRKRFGLVSLLVTLPIIAYLLVHHGASYMVAGLIIIAIIPSFFAAISDSILEMVPKLHQDIRPLQKNQIQVSSVRFLLNAISLFLLPYTFFALIANSIPRIWGNYKLLKISSKFADIAESPDPAVKKNILKSVTRTMPIVIYYCLSSQISIWLASFFGSTNLISELGALGRLSLIFNSLILVFSTLVAPRFSRLIANRHNLTKLFFLIQAIVIALNIVILFATWTFSDMILWVLGENYRNLQSELLIMSLSGCISLLTGVCSQLVISRGWFIKPGYLILVNIISTIIGLKVFNFSTLTGVLYLNILISGFHYLLMLTFGMLSIFKTESLSLQAD